MKYLKILWVIIINIACIYTFVVNYYTIRSVNREIQYIRKLLSLIEVAYFNCENLNKNEKE